MTGHVVERPVISLVYLISEKKNTLFVTENMKPCQTELKYMYTNPITLSFLLSLPTQEDS